MISSDNLSIGKIKDYLVENDVHPSFQRLKIMEYLVKNKNHPSVDKIFASVIQEIPTLSKTTVYNTLNLFSEKKIVQVLGIGDNEARYDYNITEHIHFRCHSCGEIYDIFADIDSPLFESDTIEGHMIEEKHFYLKGICKHCMEKQN